MENFRTSEPRHPHHAEAMSLSQHLQRSHIPTDLPLAGHSPSHSDVHRDAAGHIVSLNLDASHLYKNSESYHHHARHHESHKAPQGIDVSAVRGHINWHRAKGAHIGFAMIKSTEGATFRDRRFQENWRGSERAGIVHGAYHFFLPNRSAQSQVKNFVGAVHHLKRGDLPPVLDLEQPRRGPQWDPSHPKRNADKVIAWLHGVTKALGVKPIIYMNPSFAGDYLGNDRRLAAYHLWVAHYHTASPDIPEPFGRYTIWQYSRNGHTPGVRGVVDRDHFNGTRTQFDRLRKR